MRRRHSVVAGIVAALTLTPLAHAQVFAQRLVPSPSHWPLGSESAGAIVERTLPASRPPRQSMEGVQDVRPMLLSLGLPGAGQHVLGQRRKWVYVALEALGWSLWVERRMAAADYRDRYRDFAWDEARLRSDVRVDGSFAYYETMSHWPRSGAFDSDATVGGVQPELDPSTYNGWMWQLATGLFLGGGPADENDPAYASALAYYRSRAYGEGFLWDWGSEDAGREQLSHLISESDRRFSHATNVLGAILANHVVSSIDAYLAARGRASPAELRVSPHPGLGGHAWSAVVRVPWPR